MSRRRARDLVFRALFVADQGNTAFADVWRRIRAHPSEALDDSEDQDSFVLPQEDLVFADRIAEAYQHHHEAIDAALRDAIEGWSFQQMSQTDLNVLRVAATELQYLPDVPSKVTVEMAVRMAKTFGGEDSGRFVNAVASKIAAHGLNADGQEVDA